MLHLLLSGSFNWSILQEKLWIFESFILKNVNVIYVKNESAMSSAMFLSKHVLIPKRNIYVTNRRYVARSQAWERVEIDKCKVMVNARVRAAKRIKRGVLQLRILSVHKDAEGYLSHYYESSGPWSWMSFIHKSSKASLICFSMSSSYCNLKHSDKDLLSFKKNKPKLNSCFSCSFWWLIKTFYNLIFEIKSSFLSNDLFK